MRKLFTAVILTLLATTGSAMADRGHSRHDRFGSRDHRVIIRDHRNHRVNNRRPAYVQPRRVVRRPVYVNNGRYRFHDGRTVVYRRPIINVRYTNYRYRPALLAENYEAIPGYIWIAGNWQWNGYQWIWLSGHYEVDQRYSGYPDGYNDGYNYNYNYSYAPVSDDDGC